jgi:hypothetical protein
VVIRETGSKQIGRIVQQRKRKKLWNENLIIVQPQRFTHRMEMRKRSIAEAGKTFPIFSSIFNATLRLKVNF